MYGPAKQIWYTGRTAACCLSSMFSIVWTTQPPHPRLIVDHRHSLQQRLQSRYRGVQPFFLVYVCHFNRLQNTSLYSKSRTAMLSLPYRLLMIMSVWAVTIQVWLQLKYCANKHRKNYKCGEYTTAYTHRGSSTLMASGLLITTVLYLFNTGCSEPKQETESR